ncbi:Kelch domain-containing protein 7A [Oryzias melastigma]|uniref:Kelch domain-containing protein 7A n=1 Tax=Oryzias melastigma TaxID=30732 RepID=A0A834KZ87_ORYME|nr:Kelch domain-containing protein 7A [Oryzias melastigma]
MPIAELLGVQFDMQLLLKLSVSVLAAVLLSWAYRFYNSRNVGETSLCGKDDKTPLHATCQNCKMTIQHQNPEDSAKETGSVHATSADLTSNKETAAEAPVRRSESKKHKEEFSYLNIDRDKCKETETDPNPSLAAADNTAFCFSSTLQEPAENGISSLSGRRSPCILKLQGGMGVGRALRQDLEHQDVCSRFLSKAEIKVEDTNIVLDGSGDQIVHGRIYEYYVESSSHSVTDSHHHRNSESKMVEFGNPSSMMESPPLASSIIMADLVPQQSSITDASLQKSLQLRHPARPALLRKESYQFAAEESELLFPLQNPTTPVTHSLASANNESILLQTLKERRHMDPQDWLGHTQGLRATVEQRKTSSQIPKADTWRTGVMVGSKDKTTDMVGVRRCLYRFDLNPLLGISVYRYHTVARLWYECSSKRLLHCPAFQCVAMDGTIFCISQQFTIRFDADDVSPAFAEEDFSVLSAAKGMLFPFVLSLPDKKPRQTTWFDWYVGRLKSAICEARKTGTRAQGNGRCPANFLASLWHSAASRMHISYIRSANPRYILIHQRGSDTSQTHSGPAGNGSSVSREVKAVLMQKGSREEALTYKRQDRTETPAGAQHSQAHSSSKSAAAPERNAERRRIRVSASWPLGALTAPVIYSESLTRLR